MQQRHPAGSGCQVDAAVLIMLCQQTAYIKVALGLLAAGLVMRSLCLPCSKQTSRQSVNQCCVFHLQDFPLDRALRFLQPCCIPDVLRFAVNQQDAAATTAILQHLNTKPSRLLEAVLNEQAVQRVFHNSRQPLVAPTHQLHSTEQQQQQQQAQQQQQQQAQQPQQQQHDELARSLILGTHAAQQHELTSALQLLNELLLLAAARRHISLMLLLLKNELLPVPASTVMTLLLATISSSSSSSNKDSKARELLVQRLCRLQQHGS
jgi:hypothetical protein